MLRCDNALLAVADPELQRALNLFVLSGRTHRVTPPAPTTAAGGAAASQVSEAQTQSKGTSFSPAAPPPSPSNTHFFRSILQVATRSGGRITSREALKDAIRTERANRATADADDDDDEADELYAELDDQESAQGLSHDSCSNKSIGTRIMSSILTYARNSDDFTDVQANLLTYRATKCHVESWTHAASRIFELTNDRLGIAMTAALGMENSGHNRMLQDRFASWSLLADHYRELQAEQPDIDTIHTGVATLMAVTAPKTAREARDNAATAKTTATTLRGVLEMYPDMSATELVTLLEATTIAHGTTANGIKAFLLDFRKSTALDPSTVGALADSARQFNVARQASLSRGAPRNKKRTTDKRDTPPRPSNDRGAAKIKTNSKHYSYLEDMWKAFAHGPKPLTFDFISTAHSTAVDLHKPPNVPNNLRTLLADTPNFIKYFPTKHQDVALVLSRSA